MNLNLPIKPEYRYWNHTIILLALAVSQLGSSSEARVIAPAGWVWVYQATNFQGVEFWGKVEAEKREENQIITLVYMYMETIF